MENEAIRIIKQHIEGMVQRQVEFTKKRNNLDIEINLIMEERGYLETTLYKMEKGLGASQCEK